MLTIIAAAVAFANNLPAMYGSVTGPSTGVGGDFGIQFTLEGIDLDDQGASSRMNHIGTGNTQPNDPDAPGTLETWNLTASNPNTGLKKWRGLYTLIQVPPNEVYYRTFKGTLTDIESEFSTWIDAPITYQWSIAIAGETGQGGEEGGG